MRRLVAAAGLAVGLGWAAPSQALVISNILTGIFDNGSNYDRLGLFGPGGTSDESNLNRKAFTLSIQYELPASYSVNPVYGSHDYAFGSENLTIALTVNGQTRSASSGADRYLIAYDGAVEVFAGQATFPIFDNLWVMLFSTADFRTLVGRPLDAGLLPMTVRIEVNGAYELHGDIVGVATTTSVPAPNTAPLFAAGVACLVAARGLRRVL